MPDGTCRPLAQTKAIEALEKPCKRQESGFRKSGFRPETLPEPRTLNPPLAQTGGFASASIIEKRRSHFPNPAFIHVLRIGPACFAGMNMEVFSSMAPQLRKASGRDRTGEMVNSLLN